jgi:hypothetical protein
VNITIQTGSERAKESRIKWVVKTTTTTKKIHEGNARPLYSRQKQNCFFVFFGHLKSDQRGLYPRVPYGVFGNE